MSSPTYIDLETAARRSGKQLGHVRRLCQDKWAPAGLALKQKPADGGKACWLVREDADAALARVKFPEQLSTEQLRTDLRTVPAAKRDEASRRLALLREWEEAIRAAYTLGFSKEQATGRFAQQLYLDRGLQLSARTLYRWERQYRAGGLAGLVDARGGKETRDCPSGSDFFEQVKTLYFRLSRPSLRICHQAACQLAIERGWPALSYRTTVRRMEALPKGVILKHRFGEEAYTNEAQPYIERDYSGLASNASWCGDHHQFDVICNAGGKLIRPWITAWQDMRSRMIVGCHVFAHDPNQDTILLAFRYGVEAHGVPEQVYVDNGKDYDSYALNGQTKRDRFLRRRLRVSYAPEQFSGVFGELGVQVVHCEPYHGQSKPIERFFGTLESRFCRFGWPTYCGNSPADKPEDLQLQIERGNAPTLEFFAESFVRWLAADYHNQPHQGDGLDGRTPAVVFAEQLAVRRVARPELLDLLLMQKSKPVKVGQNGVMHDGIRYGQYEPALFPMLGREVTLRIDPSQVSRVSVWTLDGKFVCVASANARVAACANGQDLREAKKNKARHRRIRNEYHETRPRMAEDLSALVTRAAAARNGIRVNRSTGEVVNDPPPSSVNLRPVRSPLEAELTALQNAMDRREIRQAVGAETISFGQLGDKLAQAATESSDPDSDPFLRLQQAMSKGDEP